ncbi:IS110 family transposase (plasmid) [Bacillus sp. CMF21]|nr:IS110 family transposase [Bacillus sp. CMF21]
MNPVIGLDVAKGERQVLVFLEKKMPFKKSIKFKHNNEGLGVFNSFYEDVKHTAETDPFVIFESTGHYHEPILHILSF